MCRRAYGEIRLHRPLGDQLQLFLQHLPAQRTRVAGYDDTLTTEQVAAMMPTATHAAGSSRGFYLGHTLSGSRQPVTFNLREGSDSDRNTTILSVGALGSGKTTLAQKLKYEGFLQGARVIDCDPKGDHRFHLLEEVAPHVECVTLRPDPALRGVLDPLRVAPEHLRQDAAVSFLRDLLPGRAEPAWETAVVGAVDRVLRRSREPTCLEVVRALCEGDETDAQVGRALEVYARSGLTQLGFADPAVKLPPVGHRQVTYLPIRDLPGPEPGMPRSEYSQAERVGEQIVRLIAMFAMHLMSAERGRLKLFSFDEGWRLLGDPVGPHAAGLAAANGPLGACGADHQHAAGHRHADRRARVAREPDRRDVRVRDALGGRGGARADAARARPGRQADAPEPAGARSGALPVPRPQRTRGGDPGRRRGAVAAAGVLDDADELSEGAGDRAGDARRARGRRRHTRMRPRPRSRWRAGARWRRSGSAVRRSRAAHAVREERAPTGPPLTSGEAGTGATGGEEDAAEVSQSDGDPLVSNGLGSPTCRDALAGELSQASRRNCETSGFVAAPAPTGELRDRRAHRHRRARASAQVER